MTNYDGTRICSVPDSEGAMDVICAWPHRDIRWTFQSALQGFEAQSFKAALELAFSYWSAVCNIQPRYVAPNEAHNILIDYQQGQPGGVLADCQLPCGASSVSKVLMRLDRTENWVVSANPLPNEIDLIGTVAHELGHGLGLSHSEGAIDLMNPIYRAGVRKPGPLSIPQAQLRYGPPAPITPTPPIPPTTGDWIKVVEVLFKNGEIFVRKS